LLVDAPGEEVSPVLLPLVLLPLVLSVPLLAFFSDFVLFAGLVAGSVLAAVPLIAAPLSVCWPTGAVPAELPEAPEEEDVPDAPEEDIPDLLEPEVEAPLVELDFFFGLVAGSLLPEAPEEDIPDLLEPEGEVPLVEVEVPVPPAMPASLPVVAPLAPVAFCDFTCCDWELLLPVAPDVWASAMEETEATITNDRVLSVFSVMSNSLNMYSLEKAILQ
jgi:hypothetical protein